MSTAHEIRMKQRAAERKILPAIWQWQTVVYDVWGRVICYVEYEMPRVNRDAEVWTSHEEDAVRE